MTIGRIPSVEGGIQPTIFDAKADLLTATANDTPARLAVGSNNQVLTADSSTATGLKWATPTVGGMTLITTTTTDNTVGTYTYSSLGSYKHILIVGERMEHSGAAAASQWKMRFNGDTGATKYVYSVAQMNGSTYSAKTTGGSSQESAIVMCDPAGATIAPTGQNDYRAGTFWIWIYDYNTSTAYKSVNYGGGSVTDGTTTWSNGRGMWVDSAAITSITLFMNSGNFKSGTIKVYGVD